MSRYNLQMAKQIFTYFEVLKRDHHGKKGPGQDERKLRARVRLKCMPNSGRSNYK